MTDDGHFPAFLTYLAALSATVLVGVLVVVVWAAGGRRR